MVYNKDYRTAVQLTGQARGAADALNAAGGLVLEQFMPTVENPTLTYQFSGDGRIYAGSAEFRSFDTETPYGATIAHLTKSGTLPPIGRKLPIRELQQLLLQNQPDAIGAKMDQYAAQLGQEISTRAELARGEALTTGKLTLQENGLVATVDFGRASGNTSTAATLWDAGGATPLDDIQNVMTVLIGLTGGAVGTLIISRRILNALQKNADVIGAAIQRSSSLPSRISNADVLSTLADYGVTNTIVYDQAYYKGNVLTRVIPNNVAVFVPDAGVTPIYGGVLGTTQVGIPAEAIQAKYGIPAGEESGIFAVALGHEDPEGIDVLASAVLLPLLENANATYALTVLAPNTSIL
jgi:hypothetical protein